MIAELDNALDELRAKEADVPSSYLCDLFVLLNKKLRRRKNYIREAHAPRFGEPRPLLTMGEDILPQVRGFIASLEDYYRLDPYSVDHVMRIKEWVLLRGNAFAGVDLATNTSRQQRIKGEAVDYPTQVVLRREQACLLAPRVPCDLSLLGQLSRI